MKEFTMPEVYLTGRPERTQQAVELLQAALIAPEGKQRKVVVVATDTADHPSNPLKVRHAVVNKVLVNHGYVVIVPQGMLSVGLRTSPIEVEGYMPFQTHIEHIGDFLTIVMPYFFVRDDTSRVDYQKWCFMICPDEDEQA